jgi:hypothetical protein
MNHLSDHDLERYHLGMVIDDGELARDRGALLGRVPNARLGPNKRQATLTEFAGQSLLAILIWNNGCPSPYAPPVLRD